MKIGKTELKSFTEEMNEKIIQCLKEQGTFFDSYKIDQEPRTETNDLLDSYFKYMNVNADHWHLPVENRVDMAADHMLDYFEGSDEERLFYREVLAYVIKARGSTAVDMKVKQAEKLAELLSEDSGLFFNAFSEAMRKLEKVDQIHTRYMEDLKQGHFQGLTVRYGWSEADLTNPITNQAFKYGQILRGEEAYLFCVAMNHKDKEILDRDTPRYMKTKFRIAYKEIQYSETRVALGELEFKNAQSVAKALKNRFHFTNLEDFNVEEEVYLKDHPQIAELNRYQCKTRLYLHPADTVWEVPYAKRYLSIKKPEEYGFSNMKGVVIETGRRISEWLMKNDHLMPFYTKQELKILENLEGFTFTLIDKGKKQDLSAREAVSFFHNMISKDKDVYKNITSKGIQKVYEASKVKFDIAFDSFKRKNLEIYVGRLDTGNKTTLVDTLRYLGGNITMEEDESLKRFAECEKVLYKYEDYDKIQELSEVKYTKNLLVYPDSAEPGKLAPAKEFKEYYQKVAELNGNQGNIPFMIKAMQEDGWHKRKILKALGDAVSKEEKKELLRSRKRGL